MGLSQVELARFAGTTQQHVSLIERSKTGVQLRTIEAVLRALGMRFEIVPVLGDPDAVRARQAMWKRFHTFENQTPDTLSPGAKLVQIGELVDLFHALHPPRLPDEATLAAQARAIARWRRWLAAVRRP